MFEGQGAPDDLDSILSNLPAEDALGQPQGQTPSAAEGALSQNQGEGQAKRLWAGKYEKPEELEKAHKSLYGEFSKRSQKLNTLEALIKNPKFQQMAKTDPAVRDALAKAGYQLALEEEEAEDESSKDGWNGDERDPDYRIAVIEERIKIDKELYRLQKSIGRDLTEQEEQEIRRVGSIAPRLTVEQAWKLTPAYEKFRREAEDKRISEATARAKPNRPRPPSPLMPGAKPVNLKKPVTEMNDPETRAFIQDLVDKNQ